MHAQHSIAEMWLVNLNENQVVALREPSPQDYCLNRQVLPGEMVSPLTFPDVTIDVKEVAG